MKNIKLISCDVIFFWAIEHNIQWPVWYFYFKLHVPYIELWFLSSKFFFPGCFLFHHFQHICPDPTPEKNLFAFSPKYIMNPHFSLLFITVNPSSLSPWTTKIALHCLSFSTLLIHQGAEKVIFILCKIISYHFPTSSLSNNFPLNFEEYSNSILASRFFIINFCLCLLYLIVSRSDCFP